MGALDYIGDPLLHTKLLLHPAHVRMTEIVTELITEVRAAGDRSGLREPQEHMLGYLLEAERLFSAQHRLAKRGGGDELELTFWRRARTQLKSVGDAVAWRFLGYRRQQIVFLGGNQPPGLISGKPGSEVELAAFAGHWDAGEPAVLTGLTNAIRIGDLLVASGDVLTVMEVKTDPTRKNKKQARRLERLVRQVNDEPRIDTPDGPVWVMESPIEMATHWPEATPHLEKATRDGLSVWSPNDCVSVTFFAGIASALRLAGPTFNEDASKLLADAEAEAVRAIDGHEHHQVVLNSLHYPYLVSPRIAPISIFLISPHHAARLITGDIVFTVRINKAGMAHEDEAFDACSRPSKATLSPQRTDAVSDYEVTTLDADADAVAGDDAHAGSTNRDRRQISPGVPSSTPCRSQRVVGRHHSSPRVVSR